MLNALSMFERLANGKQCARVRDEEREDEAQAD